MSKNYFKDEQLNAIHKEICRLEDLESGTSLPVHPLNNVETANLRRICNLAVETAIGEPVRTITLKSNGWYEKHNESDNKDIEHCIKEKIYVRNLYSVKELEN